MENKNVKNIKRGDIWYYDFGDNPGSVQCGLRPVLVLQADDYNRNSPAVVVAAITSAAKKRYLPSHIDIGEEYGLTKPSMVLLEQIRTVNQDDLKNYVGSIDDEPTWRLINNGLKKLLGLWVYTNRRKGDVMCLCPSCLSDFKNIARMTVHRMDPFQKNKETCTYCSTRLGYDYILFDKRKQI